VLENIGSDTLAELEAEGHPVHPSAAVLKVIQDKLTQKQFLRDHGIPTSEFQEAASPNLEQFRAFGFPLVQKARRGGHDGRGVAVMASEAAFDSRLPVPSLVGRFVDRAKEIAVLVVRSTSGEIKTYPAVEMCMHSGEYLLELLLAPADIDDGVRKQAEEIAIRTVEALDGVGIFGVEMFVDQGGRVLVNEVAPRTHNSGHHTIEANVADQFEQQLRAIPGLPLGSTELLSQAAMINLLGAPGESGKPVLRGLDEGPSPSPACACTCTARPPPARFARWATSPSWIATPPWPRPRRCRCASSLPVPAGAAHLPGMVAAISPLPVIGVPVKTSALGGEDSLLSIVQMPPGAPVATVAINGARNARIQFFEAGRGLATRWTPSFPGPRRNRRDVHICSARTRLERMNARDPWSGIKVAV